MAKTTMIGNFKMAGELSDANMAVRLACTLIHKAEERGEPISRGDLIEKICTEYSVFDSNYGWLGTPGPKSPIGTLYDRVKGPKGTYVMKMLPLGMPLVGTALRGPDFHKVKRQAHWKKLGVYNAIKVGGLYKVAGDPSTVVGEDQYGFMVVGAPMNRIGYSPHEFHDIDCNGCGGLEARGLLTECLSKKVQE